jgi:polysaccharide biosynthesis transport protein
MNTKAPTEELDVQKYWRVLKRRLPVVAGVFITALAISTLAAWRNQPSYDVVAKLLIKAERSSSLTGLNVKIGELDGVGNSLQKDPMTTQVEMIKSIPVFTKALAAVPAPPGEQAMTPESLLDKFKIKLLPGSDVLQVSYQSNHPQYSMAIVNAVINEYIASNISSNREEAVAARRFITSQLPQTEAAVREAEMALRRFKEQGNIIALNQETTQAVTSIGNLDTQIDQARAAFADANARSTQLRQQLGVDPQAAVELGALRKSSGVQEVLTKLQTAQSQLAVERVRYRDNHPIVINLRGQVNSLNGLLDQRVAEVINRNQTIAVGKLQADDLKQNLTASYLQSEVDVTGLSQRIAQLSALQESQKKRATALPGLEKTQRELERQLKAAQTTYETLLAKLQEVQVAENQRMGNVRVLQPATLPEKPSPSRKGLTIVAGSIAGLLLGVALAFLIDLLDQSVNTLEAMREQFDYTLLGVIPPHRAKRQWLAPSGSNMAQHAPKKISRDRSPSIDREAYQMLQSNLSFLSDDQKLQSIVVTSAVDGEGKSEVAANLAVAMAQQGRRILLVDANLIHPSMHTVWDIPNTVGLSHVIIGQNNAAEAIQEVMPNLYVLTTGGTVADPMALLDSNRMATLMAELGGRYDFVLFDAPSVNRWTDDAVLGRGVDGIVLVARPRMLTIAAANMVKAKLGGGKPKVLGIVANGIKLRKPQDRHTHDVNHDKVDFDDNSPVRNQVSLNRHNSQV